jgi:predicted nucleic acid-binding protein
MARRRLRVALDANVLVAGIQLPRWPHEVIRAAIGGHFDLVLPRQVIEEARRHLDTTRLDALEFALSQSNYEQVPMPSPDLVGRNGDLVRSSKDVPIALALLAGEADIFVTSDRDFTEPAATAHRFRKRVRVMLPAVFLRGVCGWSSDDLEAIRTRTWQELPIETRND